MLNCSSLILLIFVVFFNLAEGLGEGAIIDLGVVLIIVKSSMSFLASE
jgi:hypothetical protein